jgi:hypothetical protein
MNVKESDLENSTVIKGVDYARKAIALTMRDPITQETRESLARVAVRIGHYTPEAKQLWQDYLDAGCPTA